MRRSTSRRHSSIVSRSASRGTTTGGGTTHAAGLNGRGTQNRSQLRARHGRLNLTVRAEGDLQTGAHHTVEDVGICFGQALKQALGTRAGVRRYGSATLPMDEVLVTAAIDLSGRPFLVWRADVPNETLGTFPSQLSEEFWRAVTSNGLFALHVVCHHGRNTHHLIEGVFKAAARALREAVEPDPRGSGVPSTKGVL